MQFNFILLLVVLHSCKLLALITLKASSEWFASSVKKETKERVDTRMWWFKDIWNKSRLKHIIEIMVGTFSSKRLHKDPNIILIKVLKWFFCCVHAYLTMLVYQLLGDCVTMLKVVTPPIHQCSFTWKNFMIWSSSISRRIVFNLKMMLW